MSTPNQNCQDDVAHTNDAPRKLLVMSAVPGWLVSTGVHVVLLMILALATFGPDKDSLLHEFTMGPEATDKDAQLEDQPELDTPPVDVEMESLAPVDFASAEPLAPPETAMKFAKEFQVEPPAIDVTDPLGEIEMNEGILNMPVGPTTSEGPYGDRSSPESRRKQSRIRGGTRESDLAVERALQWIISRQAADGGWNFDHNQSLHPRPCPNIGTATQARNGATGLALLPLLGHGQTHKQGVYQKQVRAGLAYLVQHMKVSGNTGSWHEADGSMYSHGLAAIAVCEAYAMTHDKELLAPAQLAINYIVSAQDPVGGGWRYQPQQAGDTSVVGWQLMALKSGHMAYLAVPKQTTAGAAKFLDSVQANSGAEYGYTGPAAGRAATSSIGLLCRMYLGWKKDEPALVRGIEIIDRRGPSTTDMYYNYYATQVCSQYDGDFWQRWNARMRDWLVKEQGTEGVVAGSWHMGGGHANERGGRLYCTAMATMILEVYYRNMPIYKTQAADDEFAL